MKLDFGKMEEKRLPEFKGGKGDMIARMHMDELGKILYGRLEPGSSIGFHKHETSSEVIYILSGKKGHSHSMINNGEEDLIFFAVVPEQ